MKLSTAKKIVVASVKDQVSAHGRQYITPYLEGSPGLGKTAIIRQIAEELDYNFVDLRLTDRDFTEITGWRLPDDNKETMLHVLPDWWRFGDKPTILFLDELPQAPVSNQNIAAQIINERQIGAHELPGNVAVVAAGNPSKDRAGTNNVPSQLKDRLTHLEVTADLDDACMYFAKIGVHPIVIGYNRARGVEVLHNFDKDAKASPTPRSWEKISTILSFELGETEERYAIAGTVGESICADFFAFRELREKFPTVDEVIADPDKAPLPDEPDIAYAISAGLASAIKKENAGPIVTYLKRIPQKEITAFAIASAVTRDNSLRANDDVREWILEEGVKIICD